MERIVDYARAFAADARDWAEEGRLWWARIPLLLWGLFVLSRVVVNARNFTPFDWVNLAIHEMGHMLFMPFGQFLGIAGGSILQLLVPLIVAGSFFRQRDYFALAFSFCWLGESLLNLSHYVGDAVAEALPLVSLFAGEPIHDWNWLLRYTGMLPHTNLLAGLVRFSAFVNVLAFLALGGWLTWRMRAHAVEMNDDG